VNALIVDFDGVLADSFHLLYRLNARAFQHAGLSLTEAGYRALFHANVHASLARLVRNRTARERVLRFKRDHFSSSYRRVKLFAFAPALVRRLGRGHALAIVSSSPRDAVLRTLDRYRLTSHFTVVSGSSASSKAGALREALAILGSSRAETGFITDTVGDVAVGRRLGLRMLAVTWGFHGRGELRAAGPERLFVKPQTLLNYLDPLEARR
jgi:phosphoglycolate phosphatase